MPDAVLVLNAGSSSLKFSAFAAEGGSEALAHGQVAGLGTAPRFTLDGSAHALPAGATHEDALAVVLERCRAKLGDATLVAAGHRVVHGGLKFTAPVRVDDGVLSQLDELVPLAPLHQPHNLAAIRAVAKYAPGVPQVACFDTAFHRTQPPLAQRFALPRELTDSGVIRYGFHGLSYEYIASVLPGTDPHAASGRTVVAHLGNGASLCAMRACKSVATTMGFTPADGLVMGTRCGALDPGVVLYLMNHRGMTATQVEHLIDHESGLLGVSGVSSDMRELLASADPRAAEAVDLFVYRIGRELGSLAAALGGLDALVFTGGIGEHAAPVRDRVVRAAAWLGAFAVHVIPTNEELMIATHTRRVLGL
ncbi:acetate kinase : Acetate kinase OS=Singulisphaera acidiphila (strain ATCC BAA-1392 / DSM 18658 / VKM B-2454 / MOB10) GN=ackA PE=3 SV=1: Acetate_kinase [Gemmataceae bacterium]|nr:acetate kinase : Acetate kinase OS=Singulisphaera acidiphila (strain ATCC BAA-1392 / DSM 18658 / VKM B-2454 / MOB10) GN=ackA PE=3 SV=1: Acetate_kinase [Gemmataceae bacterium]VTU01934.1 acetate kinase : Acetate kinase OS=Singulisphaera acidiphila (strain ATCC BAA-1392 / DSM 18658 / VKM B-2454 / MOB10) GN=ackA PE=3 SV=1: Acetate_kinase [Gemmataceae bacterium]